MLLHDIIHGTGELDWRGYARILSPAHYFSKTLCASDVCCVFGSGVTRWFCCGVCYVHFGQHGRSLVCVVISRLMASHSPFKTTRLSPFLSPITHNHHVA